MSTRCSVYYETGGIHVFTDSAEPHDGLWLEYSHGPFLMTLPLSKEFSDVIQAALKKWAARKVKLEARAQRKAARR